MNVHEYQAKELLQSFDLPIPKGFLVHTPLEAEWAVRRLGGPSVLKAQIHAGGRGKGGGIKLVKTPEEAREKAQNILGMQLVTPQTGASGKKVNKLLVTIANDIEKEFYLSLVLNREKACLTFIASSEGGMDIEEVAAHTPEKLHKLNVEPGTMGDHLWPYVGRTLASKLNLPPSLHQEFFKILDGIYQAFMKYDCSLIEINPLAIVKAGNFEIIDCKMNIDDNALFRQALISGMRDYMEEDSRELAASKFNLSYVSLDGNIGCLVNGAGLAMATMDIIKQYGGNPANFLDVGGGNSQQNVIEAFRIILSDKSIKGIFVNIFGGIMKCDFIANGIVTAAKEIGITVPMVVRLEGTNVELGQQIIASSGFNIQNASGMGDGAQKIVAAVGKS